MVIPEEALQVLILSDADIQTLIEDRIYPLVAPQKASFPRVTYQRISTEYDEHTLGPSGLVRSIIQIDTWSKGAKQAATLAELIRRALHGHQGRVTMGEGSDAESIYLNAVLVENQQALYEPPQDGSDRGIHRISTDYLVWFSIPA